MDTTPQPSEPHRFPIIRRTLSLLSGLVSLSLLVLVWNAREHIPDDWKAGFGWLYVFQGLLVIAFGAGAMVLWHPRSQSGPWRWILRGAIVATIAIFGVIFVAAVVLGS